MMMIYIRHLARFLVKFALLFSFALPVVRLLLCACYSIYLSTSIYCDEHAVDQEWPVHSSGLQFDLDRSYCFSPWSFSRPFTTSKSRPGLDRILRPRGPYQAHQPTLAQPPASSRNNGPPSSARITHDAFASVVLSSGSGIAGRPQLALRPLLPRLCRPRPL